MAGFGDLRYLNRTFKLRMGVTPTQYRSYDQVPGNYTYDPPKCL